MDGFDSSGFDDSAFSVVGLLLTIAPLLIAVGGLIVVANSLRRMGMIRRLMREPAVDGRVLDTHLRETTSTRPAPDGSATGITSTSRRMVETIEFTPRGSARPVRGTPQMSSSSWVSRVGMDVPVHYVPDRPELFLAPSADGKTGVGTLAGAACVGVVVAVVGVGVALLVNQGGLGA